MAKTLGISARGYANWRTIRAIAIAIAIAIVIVMTGS
jgi:hypothetical protein